MSRLGTMKGAAEIKEHEYFSDVNWTSILNRNTGIAPPDPYLA